MIQNHGWPVYPVFPRNRKIRGKLIVLTSIKSVDTLLKESNVILALKNVGLPIIPFLHKVKAIVFCAGPKYGNHAVIAAREFGIPVYRTECNIIKELEKVSGTEAVIDGKKLVVNNNTGN